MAGRSRTLADLLPTIGAAAEPLLRHLKKDGSLAASRFAFRAFREYIDQNVTELVVRVRQSDRARWAADELPSLQRWPRCSSLQLLLMRPESEESDDSDEDEQESIDAAAMALLPFLGLSVPARSRITSVCVDVDGRRRTRGVDSLVPSLVAVLPNLQELDLHHLYGMPYDPEALQLVYDALATSQRLRSLTLPSCRALGRIGALADCLTHLHVKVSQELRYALSANDLLPDSEAASGLTQLHRLKELTISVFIFDAEAAAVALTRLLNSLPLGLERLTVQPVPIRLTASLAHGKFKTLAFSFNEGLTDCAPAVAALLACHAMPPRLNRLTMDTVAVRSRDGRHRQKEFDLEDPKLQPLWALLGRCDELDVGELYVSSQDAVVPVVRRLGLPRCLSLLVEVGPPFSFLWLKLSNATAPKCPPAAAAPTPERAAAQPLLGAAPTAPTVPTVPTAPTPDSDEQAPEQVERLPLPSRHNTRLLGGNTTCEARHGNSSGSGNGSGSGSSDSAPLPVSLTASAAAAAPPLPSPAEVGQAALWRLMSGARATLWSSPSSLAPREASGPAPSPAVANGGDVKEKAHLLLLHGPFIAMLAQSEDALLAWLKWLAAQAAVVAGRANNAATLADRAKRSYEFVADHQALPPAMECPGVLVQCGWAQGALAALVEAVRAASAWQGAAGAVEATALPPADEPPGWLASATGMKLLTQQHPARRTFLVAVQQELQALWDSRVVSCGGDMEVTLRLLSGLLALGKSLAELPGEDG